MMCCHEWAGIHDVISSITYVFSKPVSLELKDLFMRLLTKEPENRITISELRQHLWVLQTSRTIPTREQNCMEEIDVSEEDIKQAIRPFYTPLHILVCLGLLVAVVWKVESSCLCHAIHTTR